MARFVGIARFARIARFERIARFAMKTVKNGGKNLQPRVIMPCVRYAL